MNRSDFLKALASLAALGAALPARAQTWPSRPVRLVLGTPAGTAPDAAARLVAERLGALWSQPVIVENRPGAGGMLAMEFVRNAAPDGHTLVFAHSGAVLVTPKILKAARYDPVRDFSVLGYVADSPMMVVAHNDAPGKTLADVLKAAKANPGNLPLGSTEQATLPFLVGHELAGAAGASFQHVPFNQPGQAIQSLVKGDLQYYVDGIAPLLPLVRAGRIRAVAMTSERALPELEDIPVVAQTVPGYAAVGWFVLLGPKGLPADLASRINRDLNAVLALPAIVAKMREISLFPGPRSQAETLALLQRDVERWGAVIRKLGMEPQ